MEGFSLPYHLPEGRYTIQKVFNNHVNERTNKLHKNLISNYEPFDMTVNASEYKKMWVALGNC